MKIKKTIAAIAVSISVLAGASHVFAARGIQVGGELMVPNLNIVENALNARSEVTTVVAAVKAAGLAEVLMGEGPFTVFAPRDFAFDRLPPGTVANLLKPENKNELINILTYHVVPGRYRMRDIKDGDILTTIQGETLHFRKKGRRHLWVNGHRVSTKDIISSNGVTHLVTRVLLPEMTAKEKMMHENTMHKEEGVMVGGALMVPNLNIVENAMNANNVTTVVAAVAAADLVDTLSSEGPFTVFAPTNAAFEKLPDGTVETLLKPENKGDLVNILTYHVVPGRYTSADLHDGMKLTTVQGDELTINYDGSTWWVNGSAMIETADVISSNGVTFVIDTVLLP